jgi:hypothetical protein
MLDTIKKGLVLALGLLAIGVLGFNSAGIEPTLRFALGRVRARTGTQVEFTSATGNLLTGHLAVTGVSITRQVEGRNGFSLKVAHLDGDLSILRLFDPEWQLDRLQLLGVTGEFSVVPRKEAGGTTGGGGDALEGGKVFAAREVLIRDANLGFVNYRDDARGVKLTVTIDEMRIDEYRSHWSLYDLLFSSTLSGKIDGEPFSFAREAKDGNQTVRWNLAGLPLSKWAHTFAGATAQAMVGQADVTVDSTWPLADPRTIRMIFRVKGREARWLDAEFPAEMLRGQFEGAQSLEDAGLWKVVRQGMAEKAVGTVRDRLSDLKKRLLGS